MDHVAKGWIVYKAWSPISSFQRCWFLHFKLVTLKSTNIQTLCKPSLLHKTCLDGQRYFPQGKTLKRYPTWQAVWKNLKKICESAGSQVCRDGATRFASFKCMWNSNVREHTNITARRKTVLDTRKCHKQHFFKQGYSSSRVTKQKNLVARLLFYKSSDNMRRNFILIPLNFFLFHTLQFHLPKNIPC